MFRKVLLKICTQHENKTLFHTMAPPLMARTSRSSYNNTKSKKDFNKSNRITIKSFTDVSGKGSSYFNIGRQDEKNFILKGKSESFAPEDDLDNTDPQELINAENDEDLNLYARDKKAYHRKIVDEDIRARNRVKLAIIKKKLDKLEGRAVSGMNLLTWDAKEQIKHLNLNYPETWTPERICESYPITLDYCKKLLRSKWAPRTLEEIAKHDQRVLNNWKEMAKSEKSEQGKFQTSNLYSKSKYFKSNILLTIVLKLVRQ